MNRELGELRPHQSTTISELASADSEIIDLTVGLPRYGPPEAVRESAIRSQAGQGVSRRSSDRYATSRGVETLRSSIADLQLRASGTVVDVANEILVTAGAAGAIAVGILAGTNPGDEVLIPDPAYMLYESTIRTLGRVPVRVSTRGREFAYDVDAMRNAMTTRTKMMILNSPANPTGHMLNMCTLVEICEAARRRGIRIIYDEVLNSYLRDKAHIDIRSIAPDVAIAVNSVSKRFGMPGWRIGWMIGSPHFIAEAAKAQSFLMLSINHVSQLAAADGLSDPGIDVMVAERARSVRQSGDRFFDAIEAVPGIRCVRPDGGFYAFLDVRDLAKLVKPLNLAGASESPAALIAQDLLKRAKVAVVPGDAFGSRGRNYVRVSLAGSEDDLIEAAHRLAEYVLSGLERR